MLKFRHPALAAIASVSLLALAAIFTLAVLLFGTFPVENPL